MKTSWSKTLKKKQMAWTNQCYKAAVLEVMGDKIPEHTKKLSAQALNEFIYRELGLHRAPPEVNELYLANIRKLSTSRIELIIEAYEKKIQWRSAATIDVLMSELLERSTCF
jgi:hypothetical protein